MDPAVTVLLAIVVALIAVVAKTISDIRKECSKTNTRMTIVETMLLIFLEHSGFDTQKVTRAIKGHLSELKENGGFIGCINIKELYRDKRE